MAWCWKAGGTASANTDGSITTTVNVSANDDAGFSIVTYEGTGSAATVGHGLSSAPDFIIEKNRDRDQNWAVYHSALGAEKALILDSDSSQQDATYYWNDTEPTDSVFSIGTWNGVNSDNENHVAYCWANVPGLQKFGEYTGNGDNDGPFVHLGFRPALVWIKRYSVSSGNWRIFDNLRNEADRGIGNNPIDAGMDIEAVVETYTSPDLDIDFLSDGFKIRNNSTDNNISGSGYIYCAWAEAPSVDLYGGGANAR